jgi:hypothetical protein
MLTVCPKNRGSWERGAQVWHHLNPWYSQLFEIAGTKTKLVGGFPPPRAEIERYLRSFSLPS